MFSKCSCRGTLYHEPNICAPTPIGRLQKLVKFYKAQNETGKNLSICTYGNTNYYRFTAFPEICNSQRGCVYCQNHISIKSFSVTRVINVGKFVGYLCHKCYDYTKSLAISRLCPYYFQSAHICIERKLSIVTLAGVRFIRAGLPRDIRGIIFHMLRIWLNELCECWYQAGK